MLFEGDDGQHRSGGVCTAGSCVRISHVADALLVPPAILRVVLTEREVAEFDDGVGLTDSSHHLFPLVEVLLGTEFHVTRIFTIVRAGVRNLDDQCSGFGVAHVSLYNVGYEIYGVRSHMNQEFVIVQRNFRIDSDFLFHMQTLVETGRSDLSGHLATAKRAYEKSERLYREFLEKNSRTLHAV